MLGNIISAVSNIAGGIISGNKAEKNAERNIKLQKDFAQQGIRWKVADAKAAGIHPLAALGAQTQSFAPVSIGGNDLGTGLASAGQDVSRAINATRTAGERVDAYTKTVQDLNLRRMGLENDLLASQIAKINQAGMPPPMPAQGDPYLLEGQANSPLVNPTPLTRTMVSPTEPSQEGAAIPDVGFTRTKTGFYPVMAKEAKERLEEDWIGTALWNIRNRVMPTLTGSTANMNPPTAPTPEGKVWAYNPAAQEYQLYSRFPKKGNWYVYY